MKISKRFSIIQKVWQSRQAVVSFLISCWALYLRFERLAARELWNDEIYQLSQSVGPFKPFWKRLNYGDFSYFPGDYLLTYPFVRFFGQENKWGLAIPHILMTMFGFYLLYKLCQRYFKTIWGFVITFSIVAVNQNLIFHSFELRPYAVLPTLAIASCYLADYWTDKITTIGVWRKCLIVFSYIIIVNFHAFGIFIGFLPVIFFVISKKKDLSSGSNLESILKFSAIAFLAASLIWVWYMVGNPLIAQKVAETVPQRPTFEFIGNPLSGFWHFLDRVVFYDLIGFKRLYFLLGCLVFSAFIPFKNKAKIWAFFFLLVLLPIELILLGTLTRGYWFLMRQYIYTAPLLAFFLGWLWDSSLYYYLDKTPKKRTFRSLIGSTLLIICACAGIIGIIF